jgi:nicotinamide-nucleotide amidase
MSAFPADTLEAAAALLAACRAKGLRLATAESCTGGLIAACLTEIAGSSDVLDRGYVTYGNEAKVEMLGVRAATLAAHGAVSEAVAREMALGALARSGCDLAVVVTGIAGPGGATPEKPVGLVHLAAARRDGPTLHERHVLAGDRQQIRLESLRRALRMVGSLAG